MYPANKSSQENSAWEKAINNVLNPGSTKPVSNVRNLVRLLAFLSHGFLSFFCPCLQVPQVQSLKQVGGGGMNNNNARPSEDKFSAGARADRDDSLVGRLMFSKGISAFLQAQDTQMCEFWNLWYNTGNI